MIERHIEKIVLAACVLLLVVSLAYWGASSPLQLDVLASGRGGMESVAPDQADSTILQAAKEIDRTIQAEDAPNPDVTDYRASLDSLQGQPFKPEELLSLAHPGRLLVETTGDDLKRPTLNEIRAALPKPSKPLVKVEWELPRIPRQEGDATPSDVITAHVAATCSWEKIRKQWTEKLATTTVPPDITVIAIEAEIRERRFDGTWSQPRLVQTVRMPTPDQSVPPDLPDYDRNNGSEIQQIKNTLALTWQQEILQPSYYEVLWTVDEWVSWQMNLPMTSISAAVPQEEEEPDRATRAAPRRMKMDPGMMKMDPGMMKMDPGAMKGPGMGRKRQRPRRRSSRTARPSRARPAAYAAVQKEIPRAKITPVPPLDQQIEDGEVLFWLHDTSIEGSKVYQYRLRLVLVNPLCAFPGDVDDPADAQPAKLRTPFSEWSTPVSVPQATEFFVTSQNATQRYVSVTVFRRSMGQRMKKKYRIFEGDLIGGKAKMKLIDPEDSSQVTNDVDFDTGAVVVRLDFSKTFTKKRGTMVSPTVEMYYLDETGQLRTRIGAADKGSQRYADLKAEAKRAKQAVARARSISRGG